MHKPQIHPHGSVEILAIDVETRDVVWRMTDYATPENLTVRRAYPVMAGALVPISGPPLRFTHMAVGSSSTAPAVTNVNLGAEIARSPFSFSFSPAGTDPAARIDISYSGQTITNQVSFVSSFGTSVVGDLSEVGLFVAGTSALGSGFMFCRKTFPAFPKTSSMEIELNWVISF